MSDLTPFVYPEMYDKRTCINGCGAPAPDGFGVCDNCWESEMTEKIPTCRNCDEQLSITEQYDYGTWCADCHQIGRINKYTKIKGENQQT